MTCIAFQLINKTLLTFQKQKCKLLLSSVVSLVIRAVGTFQDISSLPVSKQLATYSCASLYKQSVKKDPAVQVWPCLVPDWRSVASVFEMDCSYKTSSWEYMRPPKESIIPQRSARAENTISEANRIRTPTNMMVTERKSCQKKKNNKQEISFSFQLLSFVLKILGFCKDMYPWGYLMKLKTKKRTLNYSIWPK